MRTPTEQPNLRQALQGGRCEVVRSELVVDTERTHLVTSFYDYTSLYPVRCIN